MSYSLRDLPLPVKVVATVFLLAVGAGYSSAMLQLHLQDSKSGQPMPTIDDVVLKFTGKKRHDPNAPPPKAPVSRLEALVASDVPDITGATMAGAFTEHDRGPKALKFSEMIKARPKAEVLAERKGEQAVFVQWIRAPEKERKAAYETDKFVPPAGQMPAALTAGLKDGDAVKIRTLVNVRCATCHSKGGEKEDPALDTYEGLAQFIPAAPPAPRVVNGWVRVEEPISISKLTQSTHAHLLSFAVLFSLTGLIFAMTSYPTWMRVVLGPWVVVAVFADVSMWWLARLCDEMGPLFSQCVILTGAAAGLGLGGQITFSLFNMYGWKGRTVLAALALAGALGGGFFVTQLLIPALPKKAKTAEPVAEPKDDKKDAPKVEAKDDKKPADKKPDDKKPADKKTEEKKPDDKAVAAPKKPVNELDRLLRWPPVDLEGNPVDESAVKFKGGDDGNMTAAFFEKDKEYKKFADDPAKSASDKAKLKAERQGDQAAMLEWVRAPEAARKAAYEADAFDAPGRPITPEFLKDGKVRIKTLIDNRCAVCHGPDGKQADYPLTSYKELSLYLEPFEPSVKEEPKRDEAPKVAPAPAKKEPDPVPPKQEPNPPLPPAPAPRPVGRSG